jgi:hypothetical protein
MNIIEKIQHWFAQTYEVWADYGGSGYTDYFIAEMKATSPEVALHHILNSGYNLHGIYRVVIVKKGKSPHNMNNILAWRAL